MTVPIAKPEDVDRITACVTEAFSDDPVWSVALAREDGGTEHLSSYWRTLVEGAMRYDGRHQWNSGEAYSVWIPPGQDELGPELRVEARA